MKILIVVLFVIMFAGYAWLLLTFVGCGTAFACGV
jgi:hypothetical protein